MDKWGYRLRRAIENKNIQKSYALAVELGVAESTISRWKQSGPISMPKAIELCGVLEISMDWLFVGREPDEIGDGIDPLQRQRLMRQLGTLPPRATATLVEFLESLTPT